MLIAQFILTAFSLYLLAGLVFALWFIWFGAHRLDGAAKGAGIGFRLMILPAAALLWPVLIVKLFKAPSAQGIGKTRKGAQLVMWLVLAPVIALGFVMALGLRPAEPLNENLPTIGLEEDDR
jgi:hypothetical protein